MGKILAVDDSVLIAAMLKDMFEEEGHEYLICEDGKQGLDALKKDNSFDLILSDVNMPIMNGFEMLEEIHKDPNINTIPIAMLTTESKPEMKQRAKELGVRVWLKKPFDREKTVLAISVLLKQKR